MARENIRRPERTLSARFVESVAKPGKYFDGQGLFLRVAANGSRQWVQRITIRGKRCELGLGSPPAVPLATARKLAQENRGAAMLGRDPLAEKRAQRQTLTFAEAADRYLASKLTEFRNEKHQKQWRATLDAYALPLLGRKPVAAIDLQDVLRVLEPIWREKTATAKKVRGRIENILSWATVAGHRAGDNPARWRGNLSEMLPKPAKVAKSEHHPALALGDVARWWSDLARREGVEARALQFVALTVARSGEVRGATWDEIDLAARVWNIPAARMKNGRPHRVPLSAEAVALLESLPLVDGVSFVFTAARGGMLRDARLSDAMRAMHKAAEKAGAGYLDPASGRPAVVHGLRSTFRSWAAERGYPRDMSELALSHWLGDDTELAYQRADMLDRRRDMMAAWAAVLRGDAGRAGNVVALVTAQ